VRGGFSTATENPPLTSSKFLSAATQTEQQQASQPAPTVGDRQVHALTPSPRPPFRKRSGSDTVSAREAYKEAMKIASFLALVLIGLACTHSTPKTSSDAGPASCTSDQVNRLVSDFFDAFNAGNLTELDRLFAKGPDFQWYSTDAPGKRLQGEASDRSSLVGYFDARHDSGEQLTLRPLPVQRLRPGLRTLRVPTDPVSELTCGDALRGEGSGPLHGNRKPYRRLVDGPRTALDRRRLPQAFRLRY
jgi:hypothetical protein